MNAPIITASNVLGSMKKRDDASGPDQCRLRRPSHRTNDRPCQLENLLTWSPMSCDLVPQKGSINHPIRYLKRLPFPLA
ncbi:hypothetical protein M0802_010921 [Mischocyttarus mexicanus]|nr:hypothetical protein M0802_010921 [Mischocyttarus mexicanus]